jgi:hypothetical protein
MKLQRSLELGIISLLLVIIGQALLIALGPLTRASRAYGGSAGTGGTALLSSDSEYYLGLAQMQGSFGSIPLTRIAFPSILRLGSHLGSAETFAVAVNVLAMILAGAALYQMGVAYGGTRSAGILTSAAFTVNPLTAQWVRFVLTETLNYTLTIGMIWAITRFSAQRSPRTALFAILMGVLLALLRPNGALVLAGGLAALFAITSRAARPVRARRVLLHALIWTSALLFAFMGSREPDPRVPATSAVITDRLYNGVVVEGTPEVLVTTSMPPAHDLAEATFTGALRYVLDHPIAVAKLGILRVGYETIQLRPHYPTIVNVAIGIGFTAFLLFVALGARVTRSRALQTTVLLISIPQMALVAATFAVPESRYGWTYLVTWCVWAGIGADRLLRRTIPRCPQPSAA